MQKGKTSGVISGFILIIVLTVSAVLMITLPSCSRSRKGIAGISGLEPPPLPPPPPKAPSMAGSDTTWDMIDQIPLFPGGEELLAKHIAKNIIYPETAKAKGIQGKVVVKFRITSRGNVNGYEITKSVSPDLDAEALRVVRTITRFEPTIVDGKPVSAWYYLPITFTLK
jgi:TonB family protein